MSRLFPWLNWRQAEQVQFLLDLLRWLQQGCSTLQGLHLMRAGAAEAGDRRALKQLAYLEGELAKGRTLSASLTGVFASELVLVMQSSHQPSVLISMLIALNKREQSKQNALKKALERLLYPMLLLLLSCGLVWFAGQLLLPRFEQMLVGLARPFWSQQLARVAQILPWFLLVVVGLFLVFYSAPWWQQKIKAPSQLLPESVVYAPQRQQGFRRYVLGLTQVQRLFLLARICSQLALLLGQQRSLGEVVAVLKHHAQGLAKEHYHFMQQKLAAGYTGLADIMHSKLLDPISFMRLSMSSGGSDARKEQLHLLAHSLQQRALRLMSKVFYRVTIACYLIALLLIGCAVLGIGQIILLLVQQWV